MPVINETRPEQAVKTPGRRRKKPLTLFRLIRRFILLSLALIVLIFVIINFKNLAPDRVVEWAKESFARNNNGDGYPYPINTATVLQIERMDKDIAILTTSSLIILNEKAGELVNRQHGFVSPAMDVTDNRIIIYEQGGKRFKVENRTQILFEKTMENNILTCSIGEDGNFAVATASSKSASELTIFTRRFEQEFVWASSGFYIIKTALNPESKSVAVALTGSKDGVMASKIIALDFDKEEPVCTYEYDDTIFTDMRYLSGGRILAAGDRLVTSISVRDNKKEDISYKEGYARRCVLNGEGMNAVLYSKFESGNLLTLLVFDEKGKTLFQKDFSVNVRAVGCGKNTVSIFLDGKTEFYDRGGKNSKTEETGGDAAAAVINGKNVYWVGLNVISQQEINQ